jgi:hypothetical protein
MSRKQSIFLIMNWRQTHLQDDAKAGPLDKAAAEVINLMMAKSQVGTSTECMFSCLHL